VEAQAQSLRRPQNISDRSIFFWSLLLFEGVRRGFLFGNSLKHADQQLEIHPKKV